MARAEWTTGSMTDSVRVISKEAGKDGLHPAFQVTISLYDFYFYSEMKGLWRVVSRGW